MSFSPLWAGLREHAAKMKGTHLRELTADADRNESMFVKANGICLDYSREKIDREGMAKLFEIAKAAGVEAKRDRMFAGEMMNPSEGRCVLHGALRAPRDKVMNDVDGKNVVADVWAVLDAMKAFSEKVRSGEWLGHTGKPLTDVVAIGIGGSFLGCEFVTEALRTDPEGATACAGRRLRFLANVDPIDVRRALDGLNAETTLVLVLSKTFTTAETMLNARTAREWLIKQLGSPDCVGKHMAACSTALDKTKAFGIDDANVFGFWDWVGGRISVWSAVGALPLLLQYGWTVFEKFLQGGHAMDQHFQTAPLEENLPALVGLMSLWNVSLLEHEACAVLPYCQALVRFVAHIQQLDMESNGKGVKIDGSPVEVGTGAVYMGEPGTNGQHSFYQLMHQGRTIPAEFIGFKRSQNPVKLEGEVVANHDELMSNFFAQPDALALGKTADECRAAGVPEELVAHKTFKGDRPSLSLLLPICDPFNLGQLLALYEHRTAVQGWIWEINSFDQWGVELGKALAGNVRSHLSGARGGAGDDSKFIGPTKKLLAEFLAE